MRLTDQTPDGPLYRIAWGPSPWEYPEWTRAGTDRSSGAHTFGNRFDDPEGDYRVLYASSQLITCYLETLARFRPDFELREQLNAMDGDNDFQPIGVVPDAWFEPRCIGTAKVEGRYADLYSHGWISQLRSNLLKLCWDLGLKDFDASVLIQSEKRILTQTASRAVYDLGGFHGIYYASRHGLEMKNWALFESKATINPLEPVRRASKDDAELRQALVILHLKLESDSAAEELEGLELEISAAEEESGEGSDEESG